MVDAGNPDDLDGRRVLPPASELFEHVCVRGRHLRIELALNDQDRLANVPHDLCGVCRENALKFRVVDLAPHIGGHLLPPLPGHHGFVDLFLEIDLCLFLGFREVRTTEETLLLRKDEIRAAHAVAGEQHDGGDALVFRRGQQRHDPAFAVTHDRDALGVHVLAIGQEPHRGPLIVGKVGERRRLGASATLSHAALVVAEHDQTGVGEGAGQLAEDRNPEYQLVTIDRPRASRQHHGREPAARRLFRLRQRAGHGEAVGQHSHLLVVRPRDRNLSRCHRSDVFAHDVDVLRRDRGAEQSARLVAPDFGLERCVRRHQRHSSAPRFDQPRGGLNLLGRRVADADRKRELRHHIDRHHRAGRGRLQPLGQRFVRTEEGARQEHGVGVDGIRFRGLLSGNGDVGRRSGSLDRRVKRLYLALHGRVDRQLERVPVGRVTDLDAPCHDIERRTQASRALDAPAAGNAPDRDLLAADGNPSDENREARCVGRRL